VKEHADSLSFLISDVVFIYMGRGSSVSILSTYGLDDRAIGVRSRAEAKEFSSSLCVQTGSEAHPTSCTIGTVGAFLGGKERPGHDAVHSPHLVARTIMSRSYTLSTPSASMACSGTALIHFSVNKLGVIVKQALKLAEQ
jgi:hypothetical protein